MIDARRHLNSFLGGLLLTGGATALSSAIAFWGYHNAWYLAALLPVFMTLYVLLAWLMHLKSSSPSLLYSMKRKDAHDLPEDKASGAEMSDVRDENGLIRRRTDPPAPQGQGGEKRASRAAIAALMWSALQLAVLATALYHFFGVGATLF